MTPKLDVSQMNDVPFNLFCDHIKEIYKKIRDTPEFQEGFKKWKKERSEAVKQTN